MQVHNLLFQSWGPKTSPQIQLNAYNDGFYQDLGDPTIIIDRLVSCCWAESKENDVTHNFSLKMTIKQVHNEEWTDGCSLST